ncbi:hypothetical protein H257_03644 [Aphanomyces astaci]|uniref:Uncharacterized protein n=1 Tax=Aphanomyces astaci TaxID=112090 RepID=W4GZT9_APHAT|nr:hypothetical protein H257_03644 [Aphanomyces astaci]ETV84433.1 hypothetical protein H257_03644 [Aphanomyces astaci]|eukprot:XP_009826125.1 hypothetical protein H257_03644 [Aphanomyces astaci]
MVVSWYHLELRDGNFVDDDGRVVLLKGVNLGGSTKIPSSAASAASISFVIRPRSTKHTSPYCSGGDSIAFTSSRRGKPPSMPELASTTPSTSRTSARFSVAPGVLIITNQSKSFYSATTNIHSMVQLARVVADLDHVMGFGMITSSMMMT